MSDIVLGMPTLIEFKDIYEAVSICKKLNLSFIELNMNLPQYQVEYLDCNLLKKLMKEEQIFFTIHIDENFNAADFNTKVSKAYIDTMVETIAAAKELNIPILNMHMAQGVYFTLPDRKVYLFDEYKEEYMNNLKKFRDICTKEIGSSNVKICIENTDGYKDFMREGVKILLESPAFALTWDIGHEHSCGYKDMNFILSNRNRLRHMHIHDAKGEKNHMILGTGEIDLGARLKVAHENNCTCVIETKTIEALERSVKYLLNIVSVL